MPARNFESDEKPHRANNNALEQAGNIFSLGNVPVAGIVGYAGSVAPAGYLECNGAAIKRLSYKGLFKLIGTTYGVGDGSTTFNIPTFAQARAFFGGTAAAPADGMMLIRTGVY